MVDDDDDDDGKEEEEVVEQPHFYSKFRGSFSRGAIILLAVRYSSSEARRHQRR